MATRNVEWLDTSLLDINEGQMEGLPKNPRSWTKDELNKLKKSLQETPELFEARPILAYDYDGRLLVLGGNMRLSAAKALGMAKVPVYVYPSSTPLEKLKEIVIKDNGAFGAWDWDMLCDELGMRFYVSDAHFKELCHNGSCCGLPPTWNYSRGQFCEALQLCKKNGRVTYAEIRPDIDQLHAYDWRRAQGFNANSSEKRAHFYGMSMAEYMRWLWNNPQAGQSPYKMFEGIMTPKEKDEEGNLVYYYTPKG